MSIPESRKGAARPRRRYIPAVGPKLRKLLYVVLGLFTLLSFNAVYLGTITLSEWLTGETYQNYFYQYMFLAHLTLGLLLIVPVVVYGVIHLRNAHERPNRRAVNVGYALFTVALILLASGLVLTRGLPLVEVRQPLARETAYWLHIIAPLLVAWLFVLHRLAGPRINWRFGGAVAGVTALFAVGMLTLQAQDPRQWNEAGPASGEKYFFPSLARTATGNFIPAKTLMMDDYCRECHADTHEKWSNSVHRFASFNNPAYLFSVRNTREFSLERDGTVQASRFCAGCHDLVPFFSGAFDDPDFDDVNHPTSQAGITCTGCHAITHMNSNRGNSDYTIEEPLHYPFAFSDNPFLQWVNRSLVKAKPDFHKKTFLKPLHRTPEFCAGCHKVHLPPELNHYKWLRGQDHYDPYRLSGVSGHGIKSFYYPPKAEHNCAGCHMPLEASDDFGARPFDGKGVLKVHDHQFPSANTAIPHLLDLPDWVIDAHRRFLEDTVRVDIMALREGGTIDGNPIGPIRPQIPALRPGATYLVEVVLRTMKLGHVFTQGTADSNEVWLDVAATSGGRVIGRSGGLEGETGETDPWSHFVNAYVIDREGNRIDRRNPENIFTALYSHQIPPGAADTVHFVLRVPEAAGPNIRLEARLQYRKFDTAYTRQFLGEGFTHNDLPIVTIGSDTVVLPVAGRGTADPTQSRDIPPWQRWNDYGIGLLRKGGPGQLRQAEEAFRRVEALGRADGPLNLARVYIREGRLDEAVDALRRAADHEPPAYPWSVAYFTAVVNRQNGYLDKALQGYADIVNTRYREAHEREFDFSQDYTLLNEYAQTLFDRSKLERGNVDRRTAYLREAERWFQLVLELDPENAEAYYGLSQVYTHLGDPDKAQTHRARYVKYKADDNARDRAIGLARQKSAPANHAADAIVLYDLQRPGAYGLGEPPTETVASR
ncbi:MAG: tetratricopeptide repeat protein [Gammaproteobacteria bacterium]|jgi:Flp pilus assembly protein TadD|nr:tetratricopeptide repeat protein [Gammaproteobacteria bacterium]